jgi:twinkle protein
MNVITNQMLDDDIDFNAYLESTEHQMTVRSATGYIDEVIDHLYNESGPVGTKTPFRKLDGLFRFRPSEVTLWGGMSGHGKSLLLGQMMLGFMAQNEKTVIASMEMTPKSTLIRACRQAEGTSRPSREFVTDFLTMGGEHLWLYDQQGMVRADRIAGMAEYAADKLGVKHVIIDSLMKCGLGEDDYNGQKRFVDRLCTIAHDTGVHIHLVAHTRKGKDELTPPNKMDILGGSSITNQVDNLIMVWRNKAKELSIADGSATSKILAEPDAQMAIHKQRHGEWEGVAGLWFDPSSLQFLEREGGHPINILNPRIYE